MRKLSKNEKLFVKKLVDISNKSRDVFLGNIIDNKMNNVDVHLDFLNNIVDYRFDKNLYERDPNELMDFARDFSWEMRKYIQLLLDLEKNGMLFLFQETPNVETHRFGGLITGNSYIPSRINDSKATKLILKYAKKTIIINEGLRNFVSNDFKTDEEVRYLEEKETSIKSLKTANNTLIITIVALGLTIITSLFQIFSPSESTSENTSDKSNSKMIKVLEDIHSDVHIEK